MNTKNSQEHFQKAQEVMIGGVNSPVRSFKGVGGSPLVMKYGKGAKLFANVTADYAPGGPRNPNPQDSRQLAIVLDGTLYSAPAIREAIYGGRAEISGSFSQREAMLLSQILNAGSLPAPVRVVEQRSVEPSLGQDAIQIQNKRFYFSHTCIYTPSK